MEGHKKDGSYVYIRQQIYVVQTPDGKSHYEWSSIPYDATINPEEIAIQDELKRRMNIEDYKVGSHYSNDDICKAFLCSPQGGMRRSQKTNTLVLVANHIKSIFDDRWDDNIMYYTGMGLKGDQSLSFMQNKTLSESNANNVNVHFFEVFTEKVYTYQGQVILALKPFQEFQDDEDGNGRKVWVFPLMRKDSTAPVIPKKEIDKIFDKKVKKASQLSLEELKKRARNSSSKPGKRAATTTSYQRSPVVKAYVLKRANGVCELCEQSAPFNKKNGEPYLEVHHVKQLADGGDDTIENAVALCPNCHRRVHSQGLESEIKKLKGVES
jgi:5-methylcytosine-specific restriction protein A